MFVFSRFVFLLFLQIIGDALSKNTSVKIDYSTCKKLITNHGYGYKTFYEISELEHHSPNYVLDLHFSVQAPRDAHILLTPSPDATYQDPVYEIVLGGGGNTFSDIRRQKQINFRNLQATKELLSRHELRPFWLRVSTDGLIEVGKEGEELAFLNWQDTDPLPIRYISFGTWRDAEAMWMFDCKLPTISNFTQSMLIEVPENLTTAQKLREDLFNEYDPYVIPHFGNSPLVLLLNFKRPRILNIDENKSTIRLQAVGDLKWYDSKLKWTPSAYENITFIHITNRNIWVPEVHQYNSLRSKYGSIFDSGKTIVWHDGLVQWNPNVNLEVKAIKNDLTDWPHDKLTFVFYLGLWVDSLYAKISSNSSFSTKMEEERLQWKIINYSYNFSDKVRTPWVHLSEGLYNDTSCLKLVIEVQRVNPILGYIYHTIYFVIAMSILLTFFLSNENYGKIGMITFQFLLLTLVLISILLKLPPESKNLPNIVQFCCFGMLLSILSLSVTIIILCIARNEHKKPLPKCLCALLTYQPIQLMFFLPNIKNVKTYGQFSEQKEQCNNNRMDIKNLWDSFGLLLDRLMFIICSIVMSFLFFHYL